MDLFYRETAPPGELGGLLLSFWEFTVDEAAGGPIAHEIFPDGCVSLSYYRNEKLKISRLGLSGLYSSAVTVPVFPGDVYWGARISPAACAAVLRAAPERFVDQPRLAAELFPHLTENLRERLDRCRGFAAAIETYAERLRAIELDGPDEKVGRVVRLVEETGGEIKVSALAAAVALSPRQLERRFKRCSGLSPKQYVRARRIRATAINWLDQRHLNWADRAAEMGFTDQSHLTREFVSVTKRSPQSFAAKVEQIEHGELVK